MKTTKQKQFKDSEQSERMKELQAIPGVGKKFAGYLWDIGIKKVSDLKGKDPEKLYRDMCRNFGYKVDRCALYALRCYVYFASHKKHDPDLLKWWNWKDKK